MERAERIRANELERAEGLLGCDDGCREILDAMTRAIVNKISAPLIDAARAAALSGDLQLLQLLRRFMGLEEGREGAAEARRRA